MSTVEKSKLLLEYQFLRRRKKETIEHLFQSKCLLYSLAATQKKDLFAFDSLLPIFQKWYFSLLLASLLSKIDRSVEEWSRDEAFTYLFFFTPPVLLCIPQSMLRGQEWRWESCNPECLPKALEHYSSFGYHLLFDFFFSYIVRIELLWWLRRKSPVGWRP